MVASGFGKRHVAAKLSALPLFPTTLGARVTPALTLILPLALTSKVGDLVYGRVRTALEALAF